MRRIRVGVAGCGGVGERSYLPHPAASPYAELAAVCDTEEACAARVALRHGVAHWYTDVDAMLADSDFELLVNLTPMRLHGPLTLKALQAGGR